MHRSIRPVLVALVATGLMASSSAAGAQPIDPVDTFEYTHNMHPLGFSERSVPPTGAGAGIFNSDLAFWGHLAFQGTYEGFRIIDIKSPNRPREIVDFTGCVGGTTTGNQGDIVVWHDILVRTWNSPAPAGGAVCGGVSVPAGQEGVTVFDISDPRNPVGLAFVPTPCGAHTASGVPDLDHNRLLIYSSPSSSAPGCRGIDIIDVPLYHPAAAAYLRFLPSGEPTGSFVTINPPSSAAGTYGTATASFGPPAPVAGIAGDVVLVNDGSGVPTDACEPLVGFPAGAIALIDRGTCTFVVKVKNAQNAGAVAAIVVNNVAGPPGGMGGDDATIVIPSVMVSLADGNTIKAGLPAAGSLFSLPTPAEPERSCHDTGIILGDVNLAACAGGDGFSVWSLDPADGGSRDNPVFLYSQAVPGVTIGHTAAFTWDGEVLVFGHEPGGGGEPRCQATSAEVDKTLFFFAPRTGALLGTMLHPRPQTEFENCTWHNLNVVPTNKRYVLVSGNYQSGISVVDFTDPAHAREIAFADPAPLSETELIGGGDWSSYWYNGRIYESDMTRGLLIWKLSDRAVAGARKLDHANPQTQETSFPLKGH